MAKRAAKAAAESAGKVVEIVTRTTERRTGDEETTELPVDNGEPGDEDLLAALDDLGDSGARLEIRRTSPAEFAGYVGTYSRDGWTPDRLMEEWGGGKFTIRVRNSDGSFLGQRHVQIAGKSKNKEAPPTPALTVAAAPATDAMAQVLAAIQASNAAAQEANKGQINLLTTLVTSLINKEPPKAPPAPDPLAMLEKAANILKPRGGDEAGAMAAFIKGIDMGKSLAEGGGDTSMASVFMEGIKTIKEVGTISQTNQQRPAAPRIAAPAPGTIAAAPAAAPQTPNKSEEPVLTDQVRQIQWIKQQAAFLVIQAQREKNPELYAELFLDNLPSFLPESVVHEQMKDAAAVQKLGMIYPKVLQFQAWFEEFRAALVAQIEAPPDEADETPPGGELVDDTGPDSGAEGV
jgi:hypothetical protein